MFHTPSCYLLTLLTVDSGPLVFQPSQPLPCLLAIAGLQFFYLAAFTFLLLESLVVLHKLVDAVMLPLLESSACILLSGFLLPGLYTGFTLAVFWDALLPRQEAMCWVNLSSPTALSSILPIIFLFLATTVILLTAICAAQVPGHPPSPLMKVIIKHIVSQIWTFPISAKIFSSISLTIASLTASPDPGVGHKTNLGQCVQQGQVRLHTISTRLTLPPRTLRRTRYILLLILLLLLLVWTSGVVSSHFRLGWLAAIFILLSLGLGLVILGLRCLLDTQVGLVFIQLRVPSPYFTVTCSPGQLPY